jgi:hypothetical protein
MEKGENSKQKISPIETPINDTKNITFTVGIGLALS